jgi:hypothetical protein
MHQLEINPMQSWGAERLSWRKLGETRTLGGRPQDSKINPMQCRVPARAKPSHRGRGGALARGDQRVPVLVRVRAISVICRRCPGFA